MCLQEKHDENKSGGTNSNEQREGGRPASGGGGLDKLSREELVAKCRHLLALAQKAKAAKDGEGAICFCIALVGSGVFPGCLPLTDLTHL